MPAPSRPRLNSPSVPADDHPGVPPPELVYEQLADLVCGVPGSWDLVLVRDRQGNRTIRLDPQPSVQALSSFYADYYTHRQTPAASYPPAIERLYRLSIGQLPYMRERTRVEQMYLGPGNGRAVLEVGCGNGHRLEMLRRMGWRVVGQDIDPKAVEEARKRPGLEVHLGEITELELPESSFDAVVMNHVIEHLRDPGVVLRRIRDLLVPGGMLVAATPNIDSFGHSVFGRAWRGLEPPRHLTIYSLSALRSLVLASGFARAEAWTSCARAQAMARGSLDVRRGGAARDTLARLARDTAALWFQWRASWRHHRDPQSGEELILRAER
jgi:2-polyprenyl-3-methyl-5-hydroxy-6-metoxy-1,4-benzoquinol methylase